MIRVQWEYKYRGDTYSKDFELDDTYSYEEIVEEFKEIGRAMATFKDYINENS